MSARALRLARSSARITPVFSSRAVARVPRVTFTVQTFSRLPVSRAFSVSASTRSASELVKKIDSELEFEHTAAKETPATPDFLTEFQKQGIWKIEAPTGSDEAILTRTYKNETIRVVLSVTELPEEPSFEEDGSQSEEEDLGDLYPLRASVTVSKANGGALVFETNLAEGVFNIEQVSYYKDAKLATDLTAEADFSRRGVYLGPQFDHLDAGVQEEFDGFLKERGLDENLASFLPEYAEYKEQQEYVHWLEGIKTFLKA